MKTAARLIFTASMVMVGLSLSAYGVALAAPNLPVNGLVRSLSLVPSSETTAVTDTVSETKVSEVTELPESSESPDVTESPEAKESPEATETPDVGESPETTQSTDIQEQSANGVGDRDGAGDGYQPSPAGWAALLPLVDPRKPL